jgi:hypothetical protein
MNKRLGCGASESLLHFVLSSPFCAGSSTFWYLLYLVSGFSFMSMYLYISSTKDTWWFS